MSGYQPVRPGRPVGAPVRADRTPPSTVRPRQQPNRNYEQRSTPSMLVVGGLLLLAFIVGLVLWVTMGNDDPAGFEPATTAADTPSADVTVADPSATVAGPIVAVQTFDPDGDDEERDDLADLAIDGNPSTAWHTVCYSSQYLGGKNGVGLVADLGGPRTGTLTIGVGSAPYQLKVFSAPDGDVPGSYAGWGDAVESWNGTAPTTLSVELTTPARFVLVSFNELGPDAGCTTNPYRGAIQELAFA